MMSSPDVSKGTRATTYSFSFIFPSLSRSSCMGSHEYYDGGHVGVNDNESNTLEWDLSMVWESPLSSSADLLLARLQEQGVCRGPGPAAGGLSGLSPRQRAPTVPALHPSHPEPAGAPGPGAPKAVLLRCVCEAGIRRSPAPAPGGRAGGPAGALGSPRGRGRACAGPAAPLVARAGA